MYIRSALHHICSIVHIYSIIHYTDCIIFFVLIAYLIICYIQNITLETHINYIAYRNPYITSLYKSWFAKIRKSHGINNHRIYGELKINLNSMVYLDTRNSILRPRQHDLDEATLFPVTWGWKYLSCMTLFSSRGFRNKIKSYGNSLKLDVTVTMNLNIMYFGLWIALSWLGKSEGFWSDFPVKVMFLSL